MSRPAFNPGRPVQPAPRVLGARFQVRKTRDRLGRPRWRAYIIGGNGERIWWTETYNTDAAALEAIRIARSLTDAPVRR